MRSTNERKSILMNVILEIKLFVRNTPAIKRLHFRNESHWRRGISDSARASSEFQSGESVAKQQLWRAIHIQQYTLAYIYIYIMHIIIYICAYIYIHIHNYINLKFYLQVLHLFLVWRLDHSAYIYVCVCFCVRANVGYSEARVNFISTYWRNQFTSCGTCSKCA